MSLASCSFLNDAVWPSLTGEAPPETQEGQAAASSIDEPPERAVLFDAEPFNATLSRSERQLVAVASKLPDYAARLDGLQASLAARAIKVENPPENPGESIFDRWASAQIQLSRLNDDIVGLDILQEDVAQDAAAIAVAVAHLTALGQTTDIPDQEVVRLTRAGEQANAVLVRVGLLQETLDTDQQRWRNYAQAQSDRIGVRQAGAAIEPGDFEPPKPSKALSTSAPLPSSGERFKGRKPLMSVNFSDPEVAYKDELADLVERVRTQYPDIAFDIEVVGEERVEVNSVIRLLDNMTIDAQAYRTLQLPEEPPMLRLFPR
jgi:hypothetical protein